jgi:FkbM family methyltransferase
LLTEILKDGMVFVDIGAAEGFYTLVAARMVGERGRVLAFEPSPRERARLQRNITINELSNVTIFDCALANEEGNARFLVAEAEHNGLNTLGAFAYDGIACAESLVVPVRRLDDVVTSYAVQRMDMVKIDVEGAELRVLKGAMETLRRFRPIILMEVFEGALRNQDASSAQVLDLLGSLNYEICTFDVKTGRMRTAVRGEALSSNIVARPA